MELFALFRSDMRILTHMFHANRALVFFSLYLYIFLCLSINLYFPLEFSYPSPLVHQLRSISGDVFRAAFHKIEAAATSESSGAHANWIPGFNSQVRKERNEHTVAI